MERLDLQGQPLDLELTFNCGQAFRWRRRPDGVWSGVVRDKLVELATRDGQVMWRTNPASDLPLVRDYLRLSDDVNAIYAHLSATDPHLAALIERFHGLRLVRQDPTETLLTFICSAANSIPRIMTAVESLSERYGGLVCEQGGICYYAFPRVETVAKSHSSALESTRGLAFRGRNLKMVAEQVWERGEGWLASLRGMSYAHARAELLGIHGVGRKIADCACLFSLDKDEAVPVDTHVRQLAHRLFLPQMKERTVTEAVYRRIVESFIERYGRYAGWAQEFLYYEDLLRTRALGRGLG
ncbi:MAG: hypothetical protein M1133_08885 [Armatimonadetes bacterium]|nr:hypothetical protein [Armatimonadota bacterium]